MSRRGIDELFIPTFRTITVALLALFSGASSLRPIPYDLL
jgi:hypothetical protein